MSKKFFLFYLTIHLYLHYINIYKVMWKFHKNEELQYHKMVVDSLKRTHEL